ncbi:MAG TPA: hypothetical protein PK296_03330, partial [Paludibacteraceae bacterium]|nr:hypothetical protein [Paludibacteraceae bacterium]
CSDGIIFATPEEAKDYDDSFEEIPLKKEIFYLAAKCATRLEFVNNVPKEKLYNELEGIAGILRW